MPPPRHARPARPAMYNTPAIRTGGFGALQVEALTNRPLSIARRHLAASQLRMRDIEPDELSSSEWVRFLVMEERERERWMAAFAARRRRSSSSSSSSSDGSDGVADTPAMDKADEARWEAEASASASAAVAAAAAAGRSSGSYSVPVGSTPAVSLWVRRFDEALGGGGAGGSGGGGGASDGSGGGSAGRYSRRRPMHARRAVTDSLIDAPPAYDSVVRPGTPPPAYEPRD